MPLPQTEGCLDEEDRRRQASTAVDPAVCPFPRNHAPESLKVLEEVFPTAITSTKDSQIWSTSTMDSKDSKACAPKPQLLAQQPVTHPLQNAALQQRILSCVTSSTGQTHLQRHFQIRDAGAHLVDGFHRNSMLIEPNIFTVRPPPRRLAIHILEEESHWPCWCCQ